METFYRNFVSGFLQLCNLIKHEYFWNVITNNTCRNHSTINNKHFIHFVYHTMNISNIRIFKKKKRKIIDISLNHVQNSSWKERERRIRKIKEISTILLIVNKYNSLDILLIGTFAYQGKLSNLPWRIVKSRIEDQHFSFTE